MFMSKRVTGILQVCILCMVPDCIKHLKSFSSIPYILPFIYHQSCQLCLHEAYYSILNLSLCSKCKFFFYLLSVVPIYFIWHNYPFEASEIAAFLSRARTDSPFRVIWVHFYFLIVLCCILLNFLVVFVIAFYKGDFFVDHCYKYR